jgi:hypothetical protein
MTFKVLSLTALLSIAPCLALAASPPQLIGDWKGSVEVRGTQINLTWHVGADRVTVDSQGVVNLPGSAEVSGAAFILGIPPVGARFEGKLSDDGKTLTGLYYAPGANPTLTLTHTSATPTLPRVTPAAAAIRGDWQGVLTTPNGQVNLAYHLNDAPTADMPGAGNEPASADKSGDDYSITVAGATFTGKLSADGKTLTGVFGQGRPLVLTRK